MSVLHSILEAYIDESLNITLGSSVVIIIYYINNLLNTYVVYKKYICVDF
jgi:hypothetical protein